MAELLLFRYPVVLPRGVSSKNRAETTGFRPLDEAIVRSLHGASYGVTVSQIDKSTGARVILSFMENEKSLSEYWAGGHTTSRLRYHIVFTPKYRRRVLQGRLAERLEELMRQACESRRWAIHELSIQPDHVHLLIQVLPKDSVPTVTQILKGGTSIVIRREFPELQEFLWGKSLWADGYFAETVGHVNESIVRAYIRNQ